jgi:1,4-dihydroxy-6-naphthoate synthase
VRVAYTPDSDDAFNYYAWEHGRVKLAGFCPQFERDHIIALNRAAVRAELDIVGVSSAFYPRVADKYAILSAGNSIGRGYGPVLVSKHYKSFRELRGKRIAVGGLPTTGAALAAMFCPGADLIERRFDTIADAVVAGEFDAGVMIHEELLFFPEKGLHAIADLGKAWCEQTRLPLPVGLNLVRRDLGIDTARRLAHICRRSLQWALDHFAEAYAFASLFGRGCALKHIELFSNDDTLRLPDDARHALRLMFDRVAALGIAPPLRTIEVIDE